MLFLPNQSFKPDNEKLAIKDVIPKGELNNDEAIKELDKIKKIEKAIDSEKLLYRASEVQKFSNNKNVW